jgi:DNA-binding response OmpR family regulator
MVVDDDPGIADVVSIVLTEKGYSVETITNPEKIFPRLEQSLPGMIILDLWMPRLSGEQVIAKLKENSTTKDIPIIVVSASQNVEQIADTLGVTACLNKPFDISELEETVEKYIQR